MMKQKFELGQEVWAFKQQGKDLVKSCGIVQTAELDASGFVFYKIAILTNTKEGIGVGSIMANHASIATTEAEIDEKIAVYHEFQEQQKKLFAERIGVAEFEPDYINETLMARIQQTQGV